MAADAERLRAQAKRIKRLRSEKERREGRQITQETAAYEVGVSSRAYRTWEGVGATIKFENLKALADYFSTTTSFIEFGQEEKGPTPGLAEALPAPHEDRLAEIDQRLGQIEAHLRLVLEAVAPDQAGDLANRIAVAITGKPLPSPSAEAARPGTARARATGR